MTETEHEYEKLEKKYDIPTLKELVKEFEVKLDEPDLILHDIIDKIDDKFSEWARNIEAIVFVSPGSNPSDLYESQMVNDKKDDLFGIYRTIMSLTWKGKKVKIIGKEKEMVSFIKKSFKEWKELKKDLIELCEIFEKKWTRKSLNNSVKMVYHG